MPRHPARFLSTNGLIKTLRLLIFTYVSIHTNLVSGRERLSLRWSSPTLDSFLYDLSRTGTLSGVGGLEQGRGIEISPYGFGKTKEFFEQGPRTWQPTAGGEVTWKPTSQLATVLTVNTDFAETEVDTRQINLTRFPLFLHEKKPASISAVNHAHECVREALEMPTAFGPHCFRHTFGTRLGESGCDVFTIMRLMGHSTITVSQRYVDPTPETMENAVLALEKANRLAEQKFAEVTTVLTTVQPAEVGRVQ